MTAASSAAAPSAIPASAATPSRPEDLRAVSTRPFTGAEYLASLRDGREVYINGERVADVTAHPAMRNS
eukprot:gene7552-9621_t